MESQPQEQQTPIETKEGETPEESQPQEGPTEEQASVNESHKRKAEAVEEEEEEVYYDFTHFRDTEKEIVRRCLKFSKPKEYISDDKDLTEIYMMFDYELYSELTRKTVISDEIENKMNEWWVNSPFLPMCFGYSPKEQAGQMKNVLRVNLGKYIDREEGELFEKRIAEWDDLFTEIMVEKQNEWPVIKKLFPGRKTPVEKVMLEMKKFPTVKPNKNPDHPNYVLFKFETQKADPEKGIPEDKLTAKVKVYDNRYPDEPKADKLTEINMVPEKGKEEPGRVLLLKPRDYAKIKFAFKKIYIMKNGWGYSWVPREICYDTEENLKKDKHKNIGKKSKTF